MSSGDYDNGAVINGRIVRARVPPIIIRIRLDIVE